VDDCTRFCIGLVPILNQSFAPLWDALWELFGVYGLPEQILCDNGPAFRAGAGKLPSALEGRLLRLGVRTCHGRPYHPQTQGKVERFHLTLDTELGTGLRQPTAQQAKSVYEDYRKLYNWVRPHEALGQVSPGSLYKASPRKRPERLPEHELPERAIARRLDSWGNFSFKGVRYKLGRGLATERIELRQVESGEFAALYFGVVLGLLADLRV
jgi:hypothetical protein